MPRALEEWAATDKNMFGELARGDVCPHDPAMTYAWPGRTVCVSSASRPCVVSVFAPCTLANGGKLFYPLPGEKDSFCAVAAAGWTEASALAQHGTPEAERQFHRACHVQIVPAAALTTIQH